MIRHTKEGQCKSIVAITIQSIEMSALTSRRAPTPPNNGGIDIGKSMLKDSTTDQRTPAASRRITRFLTNKLWCITLPAFVALSRLALYGRM